MGAEENKALVRKLLEATWKNRDWATVNNLVMPNATTHGPFTEQISPGPEGAKAFASIFLDAFPDVTYTIDKEEVDGDLVKTWITYTGTNTGSLMGNPPTGKRVTTPVMATNRIMNGKIAESWAEWDTEAFMRQLGMSASA